jgi:hypothetical protein
LGTGDGVILASRELWVYVMLETDFDMFDLPRFTHRCLECSRFEPILVLYAQQCESIERLHQKNDKKTRE